MVSDIEKAKRALIAVIRSLSLLYNCCFDISRESVDTAITKAYRSLSRKVHPDKGGRPGDQTRLNAAHDVWTDVLKNRETRGKFFGVAVGCCRFVCSRLTMCLCKMISALFRASFSLLPVFFYVAFGERLGPL